MGASTESELSQRVAALAARDERTRAARAERSLEIDSLQQDFPPETIGLVGGGHESAWFFVEAIGCYLHGFDAAALVCAHASCEREIAGRVNHLGANAPRGWERWGLGALLQYAATEGWYTASSQALLEEVNRKRREFYHFRSEWTADSIVMRTYQQLPWRGKDGAREDMAQVLRADALQALRAAFILRAE
ncbi:hypothetical protein [Streptomyces viridosporus]|uniref:hypothetical protein n=1 Tax=Streptomyces viridosporus TaxID=67581 RepID=UPI00117F223E|nr:hypothetical protein [Streptomyces viridosporus]